MMCKQSLERLVSCLPQAVGALAALKMVHVGKSVPLDEMLTAIECLAAEFSAKPGNKPRSAYSALVGAQGEGQSQGERACRFWPSGRVPTAGLGTRVGQVSM